MTIEWISIKYIFPGHVMLLTPCTAGYVKILFPGQRSVMAATMQTAAVMSNMLQFMKLIGQLKVRNLPKLVCLSSSECYKRRRRESRFLGVWDYV